MKIKFLLPILITLYFVNISFSNEVKLMVKVDDQIITNVDLMDQQKFLLIFNDNLKNLSPSDLQKISKKELIKEIIKKKEIDKFIKYDDKSDLSEKLVKESFLAQGFKNKSEFISFLKYKNFNYEIFKNKLLIEKLWNTLVYEKYNNKVKINEQEIKKKLSIFYSKQEKKFEVNISEIIFKLNTDFKEVADFITNNSFESAVLKYSISDTSSNGGKIGWVSVNNLTNNLKKKILNLKIGGITEPLKLANGYIILKLNSKREISSKINLDEEVIKKINFEKNRQLNSFSLNYYNKIKQNTVIYEY